MVEIYYFLSRSRPENMPKYSKSKIKYIIDKHDFKALYQNCQNIREKTYLTVLWLTAGRPEEVLLLKKKDINIQPEKTSIKMQVKKLGYTKENKFIIEQRHLVLKTSSEKYYIKNLKKYIDKYKDPKQKIFQFTKRTGLNILHRLGEQTLGFSICHYNFRHSRMTLLAEAGATKEDLKRFKGSRTDRSVKHYIHARKIEYSVESEIEND